MVLPYFSLMANAIELFGHVFIFHHYTFSKMSIFFVHFLTGLFFFFLLLGFKGSLCILDTGPLIGICFANIFSR